MVSKGKASSGVLIRFIWHLE